MQADSKDDGSCPLSFRRPSDSSCPDIATADGDAKRSTAGTSGLFFWYLRVTGLWAVQADSKDDGSCPLSFRRPSDSSCQDIATADGWPRVGILLSLAFAPGRGGAGREQGLQCSLFSVAVDPQTFSMSGHLSCGWRCEAIHGRDLWPLVVVSPCHWPLHQDEEMQAHSKDDGSCPLCFLMFSVDPQTSLVRTYQQLMAMPSDPRPGPLASCWHPPVTGFCARTRRCRPRARTAVLLVFRSRGPSDLFNVRTSQLSTAGTSGLLLWYLHVTGLCQDGVVQADSKDDGSAVRFVVLAFRLNFLSGQLIYFWRCEDIHGRDLMGSSHLNPRFILIYCPKTQASDESPVGLALLRESLCCSVWL